MPEKEMKLSVIIPAYNEEKFIERCLKSVFENIPEVTEVIVVDNNSTDKTSEIANKLSLQFPKIKVIKETNKGTNKARQRGFEEAKGELLVFIDADTSVPAGWYNKIVKNFSEDKNLVCLSGPVFFTDISRLMQIAAGFYFYILAMPIYYTIGYMAIGANLVIKKDVLKKMGGFDISIDFYGDDTDTARRASKFGKVKFSPDFVINTSGRRLAQQGLLSAGTKYTANFFSQVFIHKTVNKKYTDHR